MLERQLNIATSIFPGFNDKHGILLCGYEWGGDPDAADVDLARLETIEHTFSNKAPAYGKEALNWRYDQRLIKWFGLWGHPLSQEGLGGDFEKTLVQSNWRDTQAPTLKDEDIEKKLLDPEQVENFLFHVERLEPRVIFFLGIKQIECLQSPKVLPGFEAIAGKRREEPRIVKKDHPGRQFRVGSGFREHARDRLAASLRHPWPSGFVHRALQRRNRRHFVRVQIVTVETGVKGEKQ
jgi:hypothetical protein